MTYQELIHLYPPEQWAEETSERDGYCVVCEEQGTPCRERIICDIADIQDILEARGLFVEDETVLTWLHEHRYSTLTYSTRQLAVMFLRHSVPTGISTTTPLPPVDAEIDSALALAGAHY